MERKQRSAMVGESYSPPRYIDTLDGGVPLVVAYATRAHPSTGALVHLEEKCKRYGLLVPPRGYSVRSACVSVAKEHLRHGIEIMSREFYGVVARHSGISDLGMGMGGVGASGGGLSSYNLANGLLSARAEDMLGTGG